MVKRIFVQGLNLSTTEGSLRKYFEQFGKLYECVIPAPPRYSVIDSGPDDEDIELRSSIQYETIDNSVVSDEDWTVESFNLEKHESFEKYMRHIGQGSAFTENCKMSCAGYAYITFVDMSGFSKCMRSETHEIDNSQCTVELAKDDGNLKTKVDSKRLFVSYFPLDQLTSKELKINFGSYGKITDVEFVSDSEGSLHFCIITFLDPSSVDIILTKSIYIRDVLMFTRRAVLRESIKMAEHKLKEDEKPSTTQLPAGHTAYLVPSQPITSIPSSSSRSYDGSAAAGYAPRVHMPPPPDSDPSSTYGYGPRKW